MSRERKNKVDATGRNTGGRYARIDFTILMSPQYRSLSPNARALLVEFIMLENGKNNGLLFMGVRTAAARMGLADSHAASAALDELEDMGFIARTAESEWARTGQGGKARCFRLTWLSVPSQSLPPTHDYERAQPTNKRARKRQQRGCEALKTWTRSTSSVVESSTRSAGSVVESTTAGAVKAGTSPVPVRENATLKRGTPLIPVNPACGGNLHTYSCTDGVGENQADPLEHLRRRIRAILSQSGAITQTKLAEQTGVPASTLSRFLSGKGLPPEHSGSIATARRRDGRVTVTMRHVTGDETMLGTVAGNLVDLARRHRERASPESLDELQRFGSALFLIGGTDMVVRVYDAAVDRHGWDAVPGVAVAWGSVPGWSAC
jgi:DNA-binding MarR family transcriptional regulator